ncbi:MAG: hypothetical protein COZ30_01120 [Candidatus Nealsonbacteria bacterium CG_4_10_14_3_um_filter_36_16]|uniref:DOD-type homing endonuclease domain-containing protein n=2 Tax=Candidatus Nealsoniibacteriota TaxID=1817911 RepID=A0A2M8DM58_9BACT|nr:MAG: hypothetical protein COZ30_01120 [Candidatus Nealsonbacteria bacterium CG_4_10_14_3_um_filter_36_16]PJB99057.1 MAG: hypothetical protein CO078_00080 [Candidatus Nealsonbacteria bacterium CG_4_9_14_0_8_um_filter_36_17]
MQTEFQLDPRGGHNRYNCNFDFFKHWTDEMAYVLGFLYADGAIVDAISSRTQYIQFNSVDKEILEKIGAVMRSGHPLHTRPSRIIAHRNGFYRSRESFILRIGSRMMFRDLLRFGITPDKSKIVTFPVVPPRYLNHFIRGYFDGDGCAYLQKAKGITKPIIVKRLSVIFTSGSLTFLKKLGAIFKNQLTIYYKKIYDSNHAFQLRYYTDDAVKIFKFLYNSCPQKLYLQRKFDIFKNYFKLRPQKIDSGIISILDNFS